MVRVWTPDSERRDKIREDIMNRLRKYRHKLAEYHACRDLYNELYPSGTHTLSGMPPAQNDTYEPERWAQRRWDMRERMNKSLDDMLTALEDTEKLTESLDGNEKAVIVRRYFLGETMGEIEEYFGIEHTWCSIIHKRAIEKLVKKEFDK